MPILTITAPWLATNLLNFVPILGICLSLCLLSLCYSTECVCYLEECIRAIATITIKRWLSWISMPRSSRFRFWQWKSATNAMEKHYNRSSCMSLLQICHIFCDVFHQFCKKWLHLLINLFIFKNKPRIIWYFCCENLYNLLKIEVIFY